MKARAAATGLVLLVSSFGALPAAPAATTGSQRFVSQEVLVGYVAGATTSARAAARKTVEGTVLASIPLIDHDLIRVGPTYSVETAIDRLKTHPAVRVAEPNYTGVVQLTPNDRCVFSCQTATGVTTQWAPAAINAPAGWDVFPGRFYTAAEKLGIAPIRIAVLDTKIDLTMPDWINADAINSDSTYDSTRGGQINTGLGADFVATNVMPGPELYHGTFVASIAAASAHNTQDIVGIGYAAEIIPITVVAGNGSTTAAALTQGIAHATLVGARVINLSLGITAPSTAVQQAVDAARTAGALVVAAAGNNANAEPFYPAWHAGVMAIGATDEADRLSSCSNRSSKTSVVAPGGGVVGIDPRAQTKLSIVACGTSVATPHVAGLAALLFGQNPSRTPDQVRAIIEATADDDRFTTGRDDSFGNGRINVERALRYGDGAPVVTAVRATPPRAQGGTSVITAMATVVSPAPIMNAELFFDEPTPAGSGVQILPADGTWGGTTETLMGEVNLGISVPAGVHRVYVRAYDGTRWGAASAGVVIIDRTAPRVMDVTVEQVGVVALRPVPITFRPIDEYSATGSVVIKVIHQATRAIAYESAPVTVSMGQRTTSTWTPGPTNVGPHEVQILVTDESNNLGRAIAGTFVV